MTQLLGFFDMETIMGSRGPTQSSERAVQINVNESLDIHGIFRGEAAWPLAVLCPGLGGWMNDLLLFNSSRYFEKHSISTLRVSFYGHDNKQRNIGEFGVKENAADIDSVVDYARARGSSWIGVIGHSYSGMAIIYSRKQAFDAAVLWDPSHTDGYDTIESKENLKRDFLYSTELSSYISAMGPGYVLSRKVFEDYAPGSSTMAEAFKVATLVINAENSGEAMRSYGQDYTDIINAPTKHVIIPNATHPFVEDGTSEVLFETTVKWIKERRSRH